MTGPSGASPAPVPAGDGGPAVPAEVEILRRLDGLIDLCTRRFRDDFAHRTTVEALTERLHVAEQGPFRLYLHPFVVGTALVLDRLDAYAGPDPEFAASIRDELLEVLELHGIREVSAEGRFDPARHEAVEVRADPAVEPGAILARVRRGFAHDGWVFRPARVVVNQAAPYLRA